MKTTWKTWAAAVMAVVGMIPLGCTSSVVGGGGAAPPPGCPKAAPKAGSACSAAASGCGYAAGPCTVELSCDLEVGAWQSQTTSCAPTAKACLSAQDGDVCALVGDSCATNGCDGDHSATCGDDHHWHTAAISSTGNCCPLDLGELCPLTIPSGGASCKHCFGAPSCSYPSACGENNTAICTPEGVWQVFVFGDCPPPPPPDLCTNQGNQGACEADPGCRWLTPGCGETPIWAPGCFTINDCAPGSCDQSQICQTFSYDPCFGKKCDACAAPASLCVGGL